MCTYSIRPKVRSVQSRRPTQQISILNPRVCSVSIDKNISAVERVNNNTITIIIIISSTVQQDPSMMMRMLRWISVLNQRRVLQYWIHPLIEATWSELNKSMEGMRNRRIAFRHRPFFEIKSDIPPMYNQDDFDRLMSDIIAGQMGKTIVFGLSLSRHFVRRFLFSSLFQSESLWQHSECT